MVHKLRSQSWPHVNKAQEQCVRLHHVGIHVRCARKLEIERVETNETEEESNRNRLAA